MRLGLGVGANDVEAILRALPSMAMRYAAQDRAARTLATWCQQRSEIVQVLHPALAGSPGHEHWLALCGQEQGQAAGLFSIILDARFSQSQVDAFCDALRLFRLGYSWGGPMSLVVPYEIRSIRSSPPKHLRAGTLVRFSLGLEHIDDLRDDLQQALDRTLASA